MKNQKQRNAVAFLAALVAIGFEVFIFNKYGHAPYDIGTLLLAAVYNIVATGGVWLIANEHKI